MHMESAEIISPREKRSENIIKTPKYILEFKDTCIDILSLQCHVPTIYGISASFGNQKVMNICQIRNVKPIGFQTSCSLFFFTPDLELFFPPQTFQDSHTDFSTSRHSRYTKPSLNCPGTINHPLLEWQVATLAHTHSLKLFCSSSIPLNVSLLSFFRVWFLPLFPSPGPIASYLSNALLFITSFLFTRLCTLRFSAFCTSLPQLQPYLSILLFSPLRNSLTHTAVILSLPFFSFFCFTFPIHVLQTEF